MADKLMESSISIAIPAYRNAARLERCLNSIKKVDSKWLALTVVTDDSGDGQVVNALREKFTEITWIVHKTNQGFAHAANAAVLSSKSNWVLLLNDDSEIIEDPRPSLIPLCSGDNLFAISLRSTNEFGKTREGAKRLVWRAGIAKILHNERDQQPLVNSISDTAYAVGGHAVYSKEAFRSLGGFDPAFHPFYWEDVDICARAQANGLKTIYCQSASIIHREDGAIKTYINSATVRYATWLNRLLFSQRHAVGIQRLLFPLGLLWHRLHAFTTNDEPRRRAIADFQSQTKTAGR